MLWERPWLLLLLLALPAIFWLTARARVPLGPARRGLVAVLQAVAWTALVVALAGPWIERESRPQRVAVVGLDADPAAVTAWREATPHADPFRVVTADLRPRVAPPGSDVAESAARRGTEPDLAAALAAAAALIPEGVPGEIALFGAAAHAGRDDLAQAAAELRARGIRVHWRGAAHAPGQVRLLDVEHPARRHVAEPFRVAVTTAAPAAAPARIELRRDTADGELLGSAEVSLRAGESTHLVEARSPAAPGLVELRTLVIPADAGDADPERQVERTALLVEGRRRVLALTDAQAAAALNTTLAPHGFSVDQVAGGDVPAAVIDAADVVVVDDLPAARWSEAAQRRVRSAVLERGTGLLLAGRDANLGPGGYAESPLADILPLETPQREERRDPSVALVLIVDTSGSMGNRIDLAKEVARLAVRRLMPHDKAGIVEFYGSKRWAAPLQPASNVIELLRALNRLQAGGGTVIYSAIEEAYYALLNVRTRFKHVLVLTDGGVESGPFEALARRMAEAGINLNTVLIGPQSNSPFLLNLAQWGRGRFYACPSRFQLPDLRFKEPQTTLLPAVREGAFGVTTGDHVAESTRGLHQPAPPVGGLVDAQPRPAAEVLLEAGGGRPLLAAWDQGAGRSAVLATELLGPATEELHDAGWSTLLADVLRSLAAGRTAAQPATLTLRAARDALHVSVQAAGRSPGAPPTVHVSDATGATLAEVSTTADDAGRFVAALPWPEPVRPLRIGTGELPAPAAAAVRPLPRDRRLRDVAPALRALVDDSGGSVAGALPEIADHARAPQRPAPALPWLAQLGLAAFLLSILVRRWPRRSAGARPGRPPAAVLPLGVALALTVASPARAQEAPEDPAAIAQRIRAELRERGHLDQLADAWADAPLPARIALQRARGDLERVLELVEAADAPAFAPLRVLTLEAVGRSADAADAARAAAEAAANDTERARWLLRVAELELASAAPDRDAVAALLRQAVALDGRPEFRYAIGHLAGGHGLHELARTLHQPPPQADAGERAEAAMRRALWAERAGDVDAALTGWREAARLCTSSRERSYALSRLLDVAIEAERLDELADDWLERFAELDGDTRAALLDALRRLDRGSEALDLLERPEAAADDALQRQAMSLAVEAGDVDRALQRARARLREDPRQNHLRIATALLLTDLRRREAAREVLTAGYAAASRRELLQLVQAAAELGDEPAFREGLAARRARGDDRDQLDALLLEVDHLRSRQRRDDAAERLLAARDDFSGAKERVRLAEALESLGRYGAAIDLYREAWRETRAEDLAFRLAWMLSTSDDEDDRAESAELFRTIWLEAGSRARRVQAEERVLDLAAREGRLADLVIELERALADPDTENRAAKRDALVKIWSRAQDTFGAREVLLGHAREHPDQEVEAWQRLAQVHLENEEFVAYDKAVRHLLEIDPDNELDYRQQLALGFLERGRPAEARAVIREMLDEGDRADAVAFEFSAGIMSLAGRHADAARLYRRALAEHPDRIETLLLWANSMAALDREQLATGRFLDLLFDESIRDDLFLVAVDGLLNLEADRPALRFAERALRRRLATRPGKVYLHRGLQDVLEALGEDEARLRSLDQTLIVAGLQRTAWLRERMDEAARRRHTDEYLAHARALLRSGEEVPPAVFLEIGEVRLAAGDLRAAEHAFERARLAPDFAAIERRVARLYEDAGRLADAERVRRRILRRDPHNPAAILGVARVVELRGARAEAFTAFRDATLLLLDGLDLAAGERESGPRSAGRSRNRSDTGPSWLEAFEGALRTAGGRDDMAPIRTRLAELAGAELGADEEPEHRLELLAHLGTLALAYGDPADLAAVKRIEDELLAAAPEATDLRQGVFEARVDRGDLDAAEAAAGGLEGAAASRARRRLAMLSGRPQDAMATLAGVAPDDLLDPLRDLLAVGHRDLAEQLYARIRDAASAAGDSAEDARRALPRARALLGIPHDDSAERRAALQEALADDSGALRARVSRITTALRRLPGDDPAARAAARTALAELLPAIVNERDDSAAWTFLSRARELFDAAELRPLVPVVMAGVQRAFTFPSRARFLELLPVPEAVELAEQTLQPFEDAEVRSLVLRMLARGELPEALRVPLVTDLRFTDLQPSDASWLTRIAAGEAELDEATSTALLDRLRRDRADDPRTRLLEAAHAEPGSAERRTAARQAADAVRGEDAPDYTTIRTLETVADLADAELRARLLAEPRDTTADLLLRAELLLDAGRQQDAADALIQACGRAPDNLTLLNRARPVLLDAGRREAAIELFLAWAEQTPKVYVHQARQVAELLVGAGRAVEAVRILEQADDPRGTSLDDRLRAIVAIDDPALRAPRARAWLQEAQRVARESSGSNVFVFSSTNSTQRHTPDDVRRALRTLQAAPAEPAAADSAGDLLAFLPEGRELARALLRSMPLGERDAAPELYRGLIGAADLHGEADELLAEARATLRERPRDAESLRLLLAAAQLGFDVAPAQVEAALVRRTLATEGAIELMLDAVPTAVHAGLDELQDGLMAVALAERNRLSNYRIRDRIGPLMLAAGRTRPELLLQLAPDSGTNAWLDGDLLTALALHGDDAAAIRDAFQRVGAKLAEEGTQHWYVRAALPWHGVLVRLGDVEAALDALDNNDPQLEHGDRFAAAALAAAVPPLETWGDVETTAPALATGLVARLDQRSGATTARRSLWFRVAALLAQRLDESGRAAAAAALRAELAERSAGIPDARLWLEDGA